jgi:hypothetical protein
MKQKPKSKKADSLKWAIGQLEKMAAEETDPKLKALWLRSAAAGYERKARQ